MLPARRTLTSCTKYKPQIVRVGPGLLDANDYEGQLFATDYEPGLLGIKYVKFFGQEWRF